MEKNSPHRRRAPPIDVFHLSTSLICDSVPGDRGTVSLIEFSPTKSSFVLVETFFSFSFLFYSEATTRFHSLFFYSTYRETKRLQVVSKIVSLLLLLDYDSLWLDDSTMTLCDWTTRLRLPVTAWFYYYILKLYDLTITFCNYTTRLWLSVTARLDYASLWLHNLTMTLCNCMTWLCLSVTARLDYDSLKLHGLTMTLSDCTTWLWLSVTARLDYYIL